MKHFIEKLKTLTVLLIGLLLAYSCSSEISNQDISETSVEANAIPVDVVAVKESQISEQEVLIGTVLPNQEVHIASEISQKIDYIGFKDGDFVHRGQLLFKLNDNEVVAKLKEVKAELEMAKLNEQRYNNLWLSESISQSEYDVKKYSLYATQARLELLQAQLYKTEIRAPFSGRIGLSNVDVGAYVHAGTNLVTLYDTSDLKVQFSVPEKYINQAYSGKEIQFTTQFFDEIYLGEIISTESGLNKQNRSLNVQAIIKGRNNNLQVGMSVRIGFETLEKGTSGLRIPTQALIPSQDGYSVFLLVNDRAIIKNIKISSRTSEEVTVLEGLNDGDKVIVSNILRLSDNAKVKIVESLIQ